MRYKCVAMGQNCLINVEVRGDIAEVKIYSDDQRLQILDAHNIAVGATRESVSIAAISENAARIAIAKFEGLGKDGSHPKTFSGALALVS